MRSAFFCILSNSVVFNYKSDPMSIANRLTELADALRKFTATPTPQNFADYKLEDGTMVRVDGDLVAGTPVFVVTEEGMLPAPDGQHTVPEVGVITTEGGKIVEVGDLPAGEAVVEEEVAAQEVEIEVAPEGDKMEERIAALEAKLEEIMQKLAGAMEANTARFDQLDAEVQKMSKVPTAEPRKRTSDAIVENIKLSRNTNFEALTNNLKNLK
jgi:L-ascorbate metabolism protein UlaG (beta-lactamase superfamily)